MNTCEHLHVSVYYRLYAAATRYDPAEYESKVQCEDCNEWMDVSDIPEDAERRELYERRTVR